MGCRVVAGDIRHLVQHGYATGQPWAAMAPPLAQRFRLGQAQALSLLEWRRRWAVEWRHASGDIMEAGATARPSRGVHEPPSHGPLGLKGSTLSLRLEHPYLVL